MALEDYLKQLKGSDEPQSNPGAMLAKLVAMQQAKNAVSSIAPKAPVGGSVPTDKPTGKVGDWVAQALRVLKLDDSYAPGVLHMIQKESSGNPRAVNNWDSNAKAGHPSKGLMQTIDSTFRGHALPGYDKDIFDPVSNIIAGIRYAQARYGDDMLKNGGRRGSNGSYKGY